MENSDLLELLPLELRVAIQATFHEPWINAGSLQMKNFYRARLEGKREDGVDSDALRLHFTEWLEQQVLLQKSAAALLAQLNELHPNCSDGISGWHFQPWAIHLRCPWSDGLGLAIAEASEWLESSE